MAEPTVQLESPEHVLPPNRFELIKQTLQNFFKGLDKGVDAINYRVFRLFGEAFAVIMGLGCAWLYIMSVLLTQQSVDISGLKPNASLFFSDVFEGRTADVESMQLTWQPADRQVSFVASNVEVRDEDGSLIQNLRLLRSDMALSSVLAGRMDAERIVVDGGSVSLLQDADGRIKAGLGTPEKVGRLGPVFKGTAPKRPQSNQAQTPAPTPLASLENVALQNVTLFYDLEKADIRGQLDVDRLTINQSATGIDFALMAGLMQGANPAPITASGLISRDLQDFDIEVITTGFTLSDHAPSQGRFAALQRLSSDLDITAKIDFSQQEGLRSADIDLSVGQGILALPERDLKLAFFRTKARLEPARRVMDISKFDLDSDILSLKGLGSLNELRNLSDGNPLSSPKFDLEFDRFKLDLTPGFEAPIELDRLKLSGSGDIDSLTLTLDDFQADQNALKISGQAMLQRDADGWAAVKASLLTVGPMTAENLLSFWPVKAADGARRWIERSIQAGTVERFSAEVNLDKAFFADPVLTETRVSADFRVANGRVKYISTMPPMSRVNAIGQIRGNRFEVSLKDADINGVQIQTGDVVIPRLLPHGGDFTITLTGVGQAKTMLELIDNKPFEFISKYGLSTDGIEGQGVLNMQITRPLLEFFDRNRIRYSVDGVFDDVAVPFEIGGHKLAGGPLVFKGDAENLSITGPVNIGPWATQLTWTEPLADISAPTRYAAKGPMDRDTLDRFGIGMRQYFDGELDVSVEALGMGLNVETGTVDIDLTNAALSAGELWTKPKGAGGHVQGQLKRLEGGGYDMSTLSAAAPGLNMVGRLQLGQDFRLINLDLAEIQIDDLIDAALQLKPDIAQERLSLFVTGRYFNASPWTTAALNRSGDGFGLPLLMTASIETLQLDNEYELTGANILFNHTGEAVADMRLTGRTADGVFQAELTRSDNEIRNLTIAVPDASKAVKAFLGLESTRGGQLALEARLPPVGEDGPIRGIAQLNDFEFQRAPFLAQILSLASLTGLADTLSGDGLGFERFDVPFTLNDDLLTVRNARLYGPALGMTGDGDINLATQILDVDGTLVPAYSANSVLGDIPVLGDLLVGEKGGGVFALNYAAKGPFNEAQISVNPLSALTPGFLRGIFRTQRDDIPEELEREIESVRPGLKKD